MPSTLIVDYLGMELQLNDRDSENSAFFRFCSAGEFRLQRCCECNLLRYPPSPACPWCSSGRSDWVPVEGKGTVHSYMEVNQPIQPAFRPYAPFLILLVELDEQLGRPSPQEALRIVGNLVDARGLPAPAASSGVGIGSRMKMVFTPVTEGLALPQWVRDDEAEAGPTWLYPG